MGSEKKVTIRMVMDGGKVVEAQLLGIGKAGVGALGQVDAAAQKISQTTGAMRGNVQNAAFQVQDFFVQVSSGTSVSRALGQQLPQLLGSMGLIGVLAGTAAAALIPMIGLLFDTADPVKELTKDIDALNKALSALRSADAAADAPISNMLDQYGKYSQQAKEVLEIQRQIAEVRATIALHQTSAAITELFGDVASAAAKAGEAGSNMMAINAAMDDLASALGIDAGGKITPELQALGEALVNLSNAKGVQDQAVAMGEVRNAIIKATENSEELTDETLSILSNISDAQLAALKLSEVDIASGIRAGADEAARLASNLEFASRFSAPDANGRIVDREQLFANMGGRGVKTEDYGLPPPPKKTRSGGGSAQTDQMREAKQLYEETRTEAERFAIEQQKIDLLFQTGSIDADTYQRAIEMIEKKYRDGGDATKYFTDLTASLEDAFLNLAITGEASFDAIAQAIERALLQAALFGDGPLGKMFGGGVFNGISGLGGDLFANIAGARANGGPVMAGLSYLVGERGPELYTPSASGQIHKAGSFGGNPSGGTTVNIIDQRSGGQAVQAETKTGPDGREIIVMTIRDATQRGELDRAQGRFGGKPKGIKR